jgi:hypothetical protein
MFRVGEGNPIARQERSFNGSTFTGGRTKCDALNMDTRSHPGHALNMVSKGRLVHMIFHELNVHDTAERSQAREPKSSILTHVDIAYMVDFPARESRSLHDGEWITIPLISEESLQALNRLNLDECRGETLACIESGPGNRSQPGNKRKGSKSLWKELVSNKAD